MQTITLYMRRMGALQFMGMNDVLQLQLLIRKASRYLEKLRVRYAPANAHADSLDHAYLHLQNCVQLLYDLELPQGLRFTVAKQRAISTLQLLQLRGAIQRFHEEPVVQVMHHSDLLQVVLTYVGPICFN